MIRHFAAILLLLFSMTILASARTLSDSDVASAIIAECDAIYHAHRPCACPDDPMRNGRTYGRRSAYNRPGGASPRCYVKDVSAKDITDYRAGKKDFIQDCEALP